RRRVDTREPDRAPSAAILRARLQLHLALSARRDRLPPLAADHGGEGKGDCDRRGFPGARDKSHQLTTPCSRLARSPAGTLRKIEPREVCTRGFSGFTREAAESPGGASGSALVREGFSVGAPAPPAGPSARHFRLAGWLLGGWFS